MPEAYIETFRDMYENAPTSDFEEVRKTVEHSTGKKLEEVFSSSNT